MGCSCFWGSVRGWSRHSCGEIINEIFAVCIIIKNTLTFNLKIMIQLLALLLMVSLTVYIVKSAEPIYRFIQKKFSLYQEKKKIRKQTLLLEIRGAELLAAGWKTQMKPEFGIYFEKKNQDWILQDHLRGWSDEKFNEVVYGDSKKE